ncbi:MAG: hypothetical protein N4A45_09320 [Flavobacteriales bacterium]|nr:hypothetical protein [Flavobacteriales bacterium]
MRKINSSPSLSIIAILFFTFFSSCNRYWTCVEDNGKYVWKKEKNEKSISTREIESDKCKFLKKNTMNVFKLDKFNVYNYDSIRIYIQEQDSLLNRLTIEGFIQGQYFFPNYRSYSCNSIKWVKPTKTNHNDWTGYHIFIGNIKEIENIKTPRKVRRNWKLFRGWKFNYECLGQEYINPSVFSIEIVNTAYKMEQKDIKLKEFLQGAQTNSFYQSGVEI